MINKEYESNSVPIISSANLLNKTFIYYLKTISYKFYAIEIISI